MFVCSENGLQWWKQGARAPEFLKSIPADEIDGFFQANRKDFSPEAVYRAKTWGRFQTAFQLDFVDLGLMPIVEEEVGRQLGRLIQQNVSAIKNRLGWSQVPDDQAGWLLQTVFWLVSGKILRDKQVAGFEELDLTNIEDVFRRVAKHYGTKPISIGSAAKSDALRESASAISRFSSMVLATTESLGYVYENTLISKTTRTSLGTHRTPSFLVDYVLGNLRDWIEDIPINERNVFEPACGHAAFLVSAMRLLTELLPSEKAIPSRRGPYLRERLHGADMDSFALELARLSLTLTDIPNPDGWDLRVEDMFAGGRLAAQAKGNTILLANPPFSNFTARQGRNPPDRNANVRFVNEAAEMLWRTLPGLPEGGVFGVVLPQTLLHSSNARDLREVLVREFELREICLFPDKVFPFSDAESFVLIGRRKKTGGQNLVRYRRIREREFPSFRLCYLAPTTRTVPQSRFSRDPSFSLRVPELEEVWAALADNPTLASIAVLGRGLEYLGKNLPPDSTTYSDQRFDNGQAGFVLFDHGVQLHELPRPYWMNLDPSLIRRPVSGTRVGTPQVLLNSAPAGRGPWRLKALIDRDGHPVTGNFITVRPITTSYSLEPSGRYSTHHSRTPMRTRAWASATTSSPTSGAHQCLTGDRLRASTAQQTHTLKPRGLERTP